MNKTQGFLSFIFVCLLLTVTACGVESYEPLIALKPPMGLTAFMSNSQIYIQFYAQNDETYFEGYKVYMSDTQNDLNNSTAGTVLGSDGDPDKPYFRNVATMQAVTLFTTNITKYTNNLNLVSGTTYFIYVKSYSGQYNIVSKPSNSTNVVYP